MTLERLGLHLGEHDRALAELMRSRNLPKRLDELAARVDELAGGGAGSCLPPARPRGRRGQGPRLRPQPRALPGELAHEMKALLRRVEDAEIANAEDREKLMVRLERMASSIDWRLQRLEAPEPTTRIRAAVRRAGARRPPHVHAPGRIRTFDLALRRRALYPLSYGRSSGQCTDVAPRPGRRPAPRRETPRFAGLAATITNMVYAIDDPLSTDAEPSPPCTEDPRPRNGGGRRTPGTGRRAQR